MLDRRMPFIDALTRARGEAPRLRPAMLVQRIGELRAQAMQEGLSAAVEVSDALAAALSRDARSAPIGPWFAALDMAARCGTAHPTAAPLLLATVGVHLAG